MALLFHGTLGGATVRKIFREGLRPSGGGSSKEHWAHRLTGAPREELTFLSTSPVAGKGGDPVAFALGFPGPRVANPRGEPGYIVVVDLPPEALGGVRAVVPNGDLDAYIEACWLRDDLGTHDRFRTVLQMAQSLSARGVPFDAGSLGRELDLRLKRAEEGLFVRGEASVERWLRFFEEYSRLIDLRWGDFDTTEEHEAERLKVLARHGIRLPAWMEEDSHSKQCTLCAGGLVQMAIGVRGEEVELSVSPASPVGRKLATEGGLADLLRLIGLHFELRGPGAIAAFLRAREGKGAASLHAFLREAEAEGPRLPPIWRADFGRRVSMRDLIRPDCQVMLTDGVAPTHVLGAIALTDGKRLLPRFGRGRGRRGSLPAQLWRLAHELRDGRDEGARIV
jgi:hypothetical protein